MNAPSLSVIVFAYNEAENITPVLGELARWLAAHEPDAELVFIDDGSRDDTLERARTALAGTRAKFLRHEENRGIGAALKTAVRACEAPWVTFLPADGQIEPRAIATLRAAASGGDTDVVFSTYAARDDGLHRKLLSFGVRALIFSVHGVRMRSDGPYLFRRELFIPEQLRPDTFFLNFEFPIRVLAAQRRTRNVVIECRPRRAGNSKSTGWKRIAGVGKDLVDLRVRRLREGW
ncbi:MAG TPA: glycosyltransferase family 2 protein [Polyangiales bacterium]|nr:glycosyltransferase family 2 protein [Polyangiales bacterium]